MAASTLPPCLKISRRNVINSRFVAALFWLIQGFPAKPKRGSGQGSRKRCRTYSSPVTNREPRSNRQGLPRRNSNGVFPHIAGNECASTPAPTTGLCAQIAPRRLMARLNFWVRDTIGQNFKPALANKVRSKGIGGSFMQTWLSNAWSFGCSASKRAFAAAGALLVTCAAALAETHDVGGEANLKLPDLSKVSFLGIDGHKLLLFGLLVCVFGLLFGLAIYRRLKNLPVHRTMKEISELIYETCKTYLVTQGKFLMLLGFSSPSSSSFTSAGSRPFPANPLRSHYPLFFSSAWSASPAATASRGSAFASTPSLTPAPLLRASAASPIRFTTRRSKQV